MLSNDSIVDMTLFDLSLSTHSYEEDLEQLVLQLDDFLTVCASTRVCPSLWPSRRQRSGNDFVTFDHRHDTGCLATRVLDRVPWGHVVRDERNSDGASL